MELLFLSCLCCLINILPNSIVHADPTYAYPFYEQLPKVARVGTPYSFTLSSSTFFSSNPSSFSMNLTDAPEWLSIDPKSLTLQGTPPSNSISSDSDTKIPFTLVATDNTGSTNVSVSILLSSYNPPTVSIPISSQLHNFGVTDGQNGLVITPGNQFQFSFERNTFEQASSDGLSIVAYYATSIDFTPLPSWLSFDPSTLTFSGTAPVVNSHIAPAQRFGFNIIASDYAGFTGSLQAFYLVAGAHQLYINNSTNSSTSQSARVGEFFQYTVPLDQVYLDDSQITSSNISEISANNTDWISFNSDNYTIYGTPTQTSNQTVRVTIADNFDDTVSFLISVNVLSSIFTLSNLTDVNATLGTFFNWELPSNAISNSDGVSISAFFADSSVSDWLTWNPTNNSLDGQVPTNFQSTEVTLNAQQGSLTDSRTFFLRAVQNPSLSSTLSSSSTQSSSHSSSASNAIITDPNSTLTQATETGSNAAALASASASAASASAAAAAAALKKASTSNNHSRDVAIGCGVGISLGVSFLILLPLLLCLLCRRRRKQKEFNEKSADGEENDTSFAGTEKTDKSDGTLVPNSPILPVIPPFNGGGNTRDVQTGGDVNRSNEIQNPHGDILENNNNLNNNNRESYNTSNSRSPNNGGAGFLSHIMPFKSSGTNSSGNAYDNTGASGDKFDSIIQTPIPSHRLSLNNIAMNGNQNSKDLTSEGNEPESGANRDSVRSSTDGPPGYGHPRRSWRNTSTTTSSTYNSGNFGDRDSMNSLATVATNELFSVRLVDSPNNSRPNSMNFTSGMNNAASTNSFGRYRKSMIEDIHEEDEGSGETNNISDTLKPELEPIPSASEYDSEISSQSQSRLNRNLNGLQENAPAIPSLPINSANNFSTPREVINNSTLANPTQTNTPNLINDSTTIKQENEEPTMNPNANFPSGAYGYNGNGNSSINSNTNGHANGLSRSDSSSSYVTIGSYSSISDNFQDSTTQRYQTGRPLFDSNDNINPSTNNDTHETTRSSEVSLPVPNLPSHQSSNMNGSFIDSFSNGGYNTFSGDEDEGSVFPKGSQSFRGLDRLDDSDEYEDYYSEDRSDGDPILERGAVATAISSPEELNTQWNSKNNPTFIKTEPQSSEQMPQYGSSNELSSNNTEPTLTPPPPPRSIRSFTRKASAGHYTAGEKLQKAVQQFKDTNNPNDSQTDISNQIKIKQENDLQNDEFFPVSKAKLMNMDTQVKPEVDDNVRSHFIKTSESAEVAFI